VCLAIPGQVVELVDEELRLARVEVAGVRRIVNVGLLDGDGVTSSADGSGDDGSRRGVDRGDWVLIHVGFALSRIDEQEALATRRLLEAMGAEYETELAELKASAIE
jgi:hydrogenase expression/formation protein HypC